MEILNRISNSDLGDNTYILYNYISNFRDSNFLDLGVRHGNSSIIMLIDSEEKNNKVYGVDVDSSKIDTSLLTNKNYIFILSDSVTCGKKWNGPKLDVIFIDTFHIKEQVLCELYYWIKHINIGGYIIFHDTNWPKDKNDNYGDIVWDRPEEAIKLFFDVESLNFENDYFKIENYPNSWGMTFVKIKKEIKINENINWVEIFSRRNYLISLFWNEENKGNVDIDIIL